MQDSYSAGTTAAAAEAGASSGGRGMPGAEAAGTGLASDAGHTAAPSGRPFGSSLDFAARHAKYSQGPQSGWDVLKHHVTLGNGQEWEAAPWFRRKFREATYPVLLPVYTALRMTIPFADSQHYDPQWLVVSVLCAPLFLVHYLRLYSVSVVLWAGLAAVAAAGAVAAFTLDTEQLPPVKLGTRFAFAPAFIAVAGFLMGVVWIDSLASEVVGVVVFLAGLCGFPSGVLGLTVLAWGNSLGDFFGNQAMARQGMASTAITACFAAPMFDLLFSLALGGGAYFAKNGVSSIQVTLPPEVLLGGLMLIAYNGILLLVGSRNGQRLPRWFAAFAKAWYGLYFVSACLLGFLEHYGKLA